MLFRRPKLIKVDVTVDVTKTRRNRDGHFAGNNRSYRAVPPFVRVPSRATVTGTAQPP